MQWSVTFKHLLISTTGTTTADLIEHKETYGAYAYSTPTQCCQCFTLWRCQHKVSKGAIIDKQSKMLPSACLLGWFFKCGSLLLLWNGVFHEMPTLVRFLGLCLIHKGQWVSPYICQSGLLSADCCLLTWCHSWRYQSFLPEFIELVRGKTGYSKMMVTHCY